MDERRGEPARASKWAVTALALATVALATGGCQESLGLDDPGLYWACTSDSDCGEGYRCGFSDRNLGGQEPADRSSWTWVFGVDDLEDESLVSPA